LLTLQALGGEKVIAWFYRFVAGLCEIAWPVGLKLSQMPDRLVLGAIVAVVGMAASGALLWLAQKTIPIGTAYAVWTGIGAAGTFIVGILFYGDSASSWRLVSVGLIIAGIIGMKSEAPGQSPAQSSATLRANWRIAVFRAAMASSRVAHGGVVSK